MCTCFVYRHYLFHCWPTYRVIQPVYMQYHRLGPFVGGAQKELGLPPTRWGSFGPVGLWAAGCLEQLVHLRGQKLRLPRGGGSVTQHDME